MFDSKAVLHNIVCRNEYIESELSYWLANNSKIILSVSFWVEYKEAIPINGTYS